MACLVGGDVSLEPFLVGDGFGLSAFDVCIFTSPCLWIYLACSGSEMPIEHQARFGLFGINLKAPFVARYIADDLIL